jgi:hypothetical protein
VESTTTGCGIRGRRSYLRKVRARYLLVSPRKPCDRPPHDPFPQHDLYRPLQSNAVILRWPMEVGPGASNSAKVALTSTLERSEVFAVRRAWKKAELWLGNQTSLLG